MSDHHPVTDLVTWARNGDKQAWDALVERCAPLVWSTCRRHRLKDADADAVGQHVWLLLLDQLDNLSDPVALPGWVATTTRQECDRVLRTARGPLGARDLLETQTFPDEQAATAEQEPLAAECHAALRQAFLELPPGCRRLITLLTADPPVSYAEISARLGIPVDSIGPTRRRCVERLRRHPAIAALTNAKAQTAGGEIPDRPSAR